METTILTRSLALNNIPNKKLQLIISSIKDGADPPATKNLKLIAVNRYAESNIPIEYWKLKMETDFKGNKILLDKYNEYISDLKSSYINGTSVCFAGPHGTGKSFTTTCILKAACETNYSCLYTTLSDIISVLTTANNDDKFIAKRELSMVDFLVIDEFDSRFMSSDNAADLYARNLENIFRTRSQNKLPTLMCTNSPNIIESFNGPLKESIDSLMKGYLKMCYVIGEDFRKKGIK